MRGTIENVWENESRNGQKYLTVQIDGERYSVWDDKHFDRLQQGAEIDYEFRQSGNFRNITEVRDPTEASETPTYQNSRDRQITRLSCLARARLHKLSISETISNRLGGTPVFRTCSLAFDTARRQMSAT